MVTNNPSKRHEAKNRENEKGGDKEAIPRIIKYRNGLLVNDKFYSYEDPRNKELLDMLKNGEFDGDVLGHSGNSADVIVQENNSEYVPDLLN
ncbi:hypothetical protein PAEPH01_2683 [Pancytospora epiphaga]|nr:hypothetical protein PAEPH01_2683 [Pancytospora epiphaga]